MGGIFDWGCLQSSNAIGRRFERGSWAEYAPQFHQAMEQEFVSVKPRAVGLFFGGIDMIGIGTRNLIGQHLSIAGKAGALAVCIYRYSDTASSR